MKKQIYQIIFSGLSLALYPGQLFAVGATMKIAAIQEWDTVNPITFQTAASQSLMHLLARDMVFRNADGSLKPELALRIPNKANHLVKVVSENGKKLLQANWEIRKEAVWGDGQPITCEDWEFGWTVGMNDNVSKTEKTYYSKIAKIEFTKEKPKNCLVTYVNDEWTYDRDLPPLLPKHIELAAYEKHKAKPLEYEQNSVFVTQPNNPGLYSGPYVVKEIKIGDYMILSRNEKFYGQKPEFETIIFKHIGSTNTLKSYLSTKEIDSVGSVGFPPDLAISFSEEGPGSPYHVFFNQAPLYQGLFFNLEKPILKDVNVRKALAMSIDKEKLVQAFFKNKLGAANSIISEGDKAFRRKTSQFDAKKANDLLQQAGWLASPNGIRQKDGRPLEIQFKVSAGIKVLENIQVYICDGFKKIGAACVIKNEPPRVLLGESVPHGEFDLVMFGQSTYPDSSLKGLYHSQEIPTQTNAWAGGNVIRLKAAPIDKLLEKFDSEWDAKKRVQILKDIDTYLVENSLLIPLYHRREAFLAQKNLQGFQSSFRGTDFVYPELWTTKH